MRFEVFTACAAVFLLPACATVETQSAANIESAASTAVVANEGAAENAEEATLANASENQAGEDRIVCKRTISTGTRLGAKRQCMTVREWREMREAVRDIMDEGQRRNIQVDVPGG